MAVDVTGEFIVVNTYGSLTQHVCRYLDDVESFDAAYFGISPTEAVVLDPQQRLILEVSATSCLHQSHSGQRQKSFRLYSILAEYPWY